MIASVKKLINYRRTPRPTLPESLPTYVEGELDKVSAVLGNVIAVLNRLDERLAALEPPTP